MRTTRIRPRWLPFLVLLTCVPLLVAGRIKLPKNGKLSDETDAAIQRAANLAQRTATDWQALEGQYNAGTITLPDLKDLRTHWAAEGNPLAAKSRWTMVLLEADVDLATALALPRAMAGNDLEALDQVIADQFESGGEERPELLLLQTAAAWGQNKEMRAALSYDKVLENDSMLAYYDTLVEEWMRARAQEQAAAASPTYTPADTSRADALKANLRSRGMWGQLLLEFLEPPPEPVAGRVPIGDLEADVVAEVFGTHKVDLFYCYERLGGEDDLGAGSMTMDLGVDAFGQVTFCSVHPGATMRNRDVRDCCCQVIKTFQFPCPDGDGMASVRHELAFPMKR